MSNERAATRAATYLTEYEFERLRAEAYLLGSPVAAHLRSIVRQHLDSSPYSEKVDALLETGEAVDPGTDTDTRVWTNFLAAWYQCFGTQPVRAQNLLDRTRVDDDNGRRLKQHFVHDDSEDIPDLRKLGRWLGVRADRPFGPYRIRRLKDSHTKSWKYALINKETS